MFVKKRNNDCMEWNIRTIPAAN